MTAKTELVKEELPEDVAIGPLTLTLAISREDNLLSVSHTVSAEGDMAVKDISLLNAAIEQVLTDLRETLVQLRVQGALADQEQKQKVAENGD